MPGWKCSFFRWTRPCQTHPEATIVHKSIVPLSPPPASNDDALSLKGKRRENIVLLRAQSASVYPLSSTVHQPEIEALLEKRELCGDIKTYTSAIAQIIHSIEYINAISETEINGALEKFNYLFTTHSIQAPIYSKNHDIDPVLIIQIEASIIAQKDLSGNPISICQQNILKAFSYVYNTMNTMRRKSGLVYHQPRHAAEMFMDSDLLLSYKVLSQEFSPNANMHLLVQLSALFHDIIFERVRISDERKSANALKIFLLPIMTELSDGDKGVIQKLIDILILGGTTPTFLTKKTLPRKAMNYYHNFPTIESVSELAESLLKVKCPHILENVNYQQIHYFSKIIAAADIQRTSLEPLLQANNFLYANQSWDVLAPFYESITLNSKNHHSLQRKLTQGLRTIFEGILDQKNSSPASLSLRPFAQYASDYMQNPSNSSAPLSPPTLSDKAIEAFAKKLKDEKNLFSEISFVARMENSSSSYSKKDNTNFINTWSEHEDVLNDIHRCLVDSATPLERKQQIIIALARVASDQDGQHLTLEKILANATKIEQQFEVTNVTARCCC